MKSNSLAPVIPTLRDTMTAQLHTVAALCEAHTLRAASQVQRWAAFAGAA